MTHERYSDDRFSVSVPNGWTVERSQDETSESLSLGAGGASLEIEFIPSGVISPANAIAAWEGGALQSGRVLGRWDVERTVAGVVLEGVGLSVSTGWLRRQVVEGYAGRVRRAGVLMITSWRKRSTPEATITTVLDSVEVRLTPEELAALAAPLEPNLEDLLSEAKDFELCSGVFVRFDTLNPDADVARCEDPSGSLGWFGIRWV